MRYAVFLLLLLSAPLAAQDLHGFTYKDGLYQWTRVFPAQGQTAAQLKTALSDHLATSSFVVNVKEISGERLAGKVDKMPETTNTSGMMLYAFGFVIECRDGEYTVTTKDWVGTATNPMVSGVSNRLEDVLNSGMVGKRRKEKLCADYEQAQVRLFGLP